MKNIKSKLIKVSNPLFNKFGYSLVLASKGTANVPLYLKYYGEDSVKNRRFYNISAGAYLGFGGGLHHPCWTNIDLDRPWIKTNYSSGGVGYNPKTDIAHDLLSLQPIPVEDSVAELVHTRFTIAAITDEAAQYMFGEVYRMLKKGGIFRIGTPDTELDYRAYLNNDMSFFYWFEKYKSVSIEQAFLYHVASQLSTMHHDGAPERITDEQFRDIIKNNNMEDALNYCSSRCSLEIQKKYRINHINWWTRKKLEKMLSEAGFKTVYLSSREQSASPVMRNEAYFDNEDNRFAMYMEAVKS
jgi:ubiquinone/menaquinone biosynthesis C-methylase UbiE